MKMVSSLLAVSLNHLSSLCQEIICWHVGEFSSGPCLSFACGAGLDDQSLPKGSLGAAAVRGTRQLYHALVDMVQVIGSSGQMTKTPEVEGQSQGLVPGFTGGKEHLATPSEIAEGHWGNGW